MRFEVETGRVAVSVTELQEALDEISRCRMELFKAIESLNGMWAGAAHDAYLSQFTADDAAAKSAVEEIQRIVTSADTARQSYDRCEQSVKDRIRAITI